MAWTRRMDEGPKSRRKRGSEDATVPFFTVRMKKMDARGLAGLVSGDALSLALARDSSLSRGRVCVSD
jgi:hypothetical protein